MYYLCHQATKPKAKLYPRSKEASAPSFHDYKVDTSQILKTFHAHHPNQGPASRSVKMIEWLRYFELFFLKRKKGGRGKEGTPYTEWPGYLLVVPVHVLAIVQLCRLQTPGSSEERVNGMEGMAWSE